MKNNEKISVIVPVFNGGGVVTDCINSILENTNKNLEIILVNDGSTDNTLEILKEFEKKDSRIIVIDKKNGGVSDARNAGMDMAGGDWIAFIDADDWVSANYFEVLLQKAKEYGCDISVCEYERTSDRKQRNDADNCSPAAGRIRCYTGIEAINHPQIRPSVYRRIIRRSIVEDVRFVQGVKLSEDTLFNLTLMAKRGSSVKTCYLPEKMYYYYINEHGGLQLLNDGSGCPPMIDAAIELLDVTDDNSVKIVLLENVIKATLSYRYASMFDKTEEREKCLRRYFRTIREGLRISDLSILSKTKWTALVCCPLLYRAYRILQDKTMLDWEREKRAKKSCSNKRQA